MTFKTLNFKDGNNLKFFQTLRTLNWSKDVNELWDVNREWVKIVVNGLSFGVLASMLHKIGSLTWRTECAQKYADSMI